MDTRKLTPGSRIEHPQHGAGTVSFIVTDYLGVVFDDSGEILIRREILEQEAPRVALSQEAPRETLPWPESTFVAESADSPHFHGSHWRPFVDDAREIIERLPEFLSSALVQTGYGEIRKPPRTEPQGWAAGILLVWPLRVQGLALILRPETEASSLVSLFPFFASGSQHTLTLQRVTVWEGGLEAQITAGWGEGEVTFFDTQYLINRAWYETGQPYDFILSGVAYGAGPAEKREWTINRHPDLVAWMHQRLNEDQAPGEATTTLRLEGAAIFLPVSGWDTDDYSFHAPVKAVSEFSDWLGQDGWRVRATVMRHDDQDCDLDILITRRAWSGEAPPQIGQDIEGHLWLQGHLWMPR